MSARSDLAAVRSADAAARALAQTDFERPLVLEAGAGTGKTATLVARVVAWAFGPGWEGAQRRVAESGRGPVRKRGAAAGAGLAASPAQAERPDEADGRSLREAVAAELLSRVVAITFTEAAAAEMAERVGRALAEIADGAHPVGLLEASLPPDPALRRERARALLSQFDHFVVRTIHGFCRRLLAQWPLEAGLAPSFGVDADGAILADCVRGVVEAAVAEQYASTDDTPLAELASLGHGPPEIEEALLQAAAEGVPALAFDADPFDPPRLEAFWRGAVAAAEAFFEAGGEGLHDVSTGVTAATIAALDDLRALPAPPPGDLPALGEWFERHRRGWEEAQRKRVRAWQRGQFTKAEAVALGDAAEALARAAGPLLPWIEALHEVDPLRTLGVRSALAPLLREVEREMDRRGALTYAGLLSRTQGLLESHPAVARRARAAIDQLLVDEFQDTDATQCEIVRALSGMGSANSPGGEAGEPKTALGLFLVGDPKQSIYGWRGADLAAYERFVAALEAAGGERHALRVNFRSVPAILDEVERVMRPSMLAEAGRQPAFEGLVPSPARERDAGFESDDAHAWAPVEHWISWAWDGPEGRTGADPGAGDPAGADSGAGPRTATRSAVATELEARALAEDLHGLRERRGVAWSSVAILLRAMTQVEPLLEALRRRGIPYSVATERSFYRRREVADAALGLRCVLDPQDRIALVGWLRSAVVGVPDAALLGLFRGGLAERAAQLGDGAAADVDLLGELADIADAARSAMPTDAPGEVAPGASGASDWVQALRAGLEGLAVLRRSLRAEAPDVFAERFRALFPYEALEAARYLGEHRVANLERFFREGRERLVAERDAASVARWLRTRRDEAAQTAGEAAGADEDAVRVLSIHGAKGLDFDHVYLLQTHRESRVTAGRAGQVAVARSAAGHFEFAGLGGRTLGYSDVAGQRAAMERAEHVRTLYVALTRARDRLVVAGAWPSRSAASPTHAELVARRGTPSDELSEAMCRVAETRGFAGDRKPPAPGSPAARADATAGRPAIALDAATFVFPALWGERAASEATADSIDGDARAATSETSDRASRDSNEPAGDRAAGGRRGEWDATAELAPPGEPTTGGQGREVPGADTRRTEAQRDVAPDAQAQAVLRRRRRERRRVAAERMARPIGGRASALAHVAGADGEHDDPSTRRERRAARVADDGDEQRTRTAHRAFAEQTDAGAALRRAVAREAGTAIHALLQHLDLGGEVTQLGRDLRAGLDDRLSQLDLGAEQVDAVRARCSEILDALERGPLLARLADLRDCVVAREIPVLLPPGLGALPGDEGTSTPAEARAPAEPAREVFAAPPLGFVAGAIDLVYRDAQTADWVVVDFKTDRLADGAELTARAEGYRAQAEVYGAALREGLALAAAPRLELWFLEAGEVVTLAARPSAP